MIEIGIACHEITSRNEKVIGKQHVTYRTTHYLALILPEIRVVVYGILDRLSQY
jgi:hypothetical protein